MSSDFIAERVRSFSNHGKPRISTASSRDEGGLWLAVRTQPASRWSIEVKVNNHSTQDIIENFWFDFTLQVERGPKEETVDELSSTICFGSGKRCPMNLLTPETNL